LNRTEHIVAITRQADGRYPLKASYHPPSRYAELKVGTEVDPSNHVYESVRRLLRLLGYDREHEGSDEWNPLSWLVKPGETVFLKPNMIAQKHEHTDEWEHVITHGSVIRALVDYVYLALLGEGKIIIGDGCQSNSQFDKIIERVGLPELKELYRRKAGFEIEIVDLRDYQWVEKEGVFVHQKKLPGDPQGKVAVNLGSTSMFSELDGKGKRYYGATFDIEETNLHHSDGKHEYAFSRSPLAADVFINLPKLKTHKKCGLTVNLKSLVGLNANKNWLPHYVFGSPEHGGDQFDRDRPAVRMENSVVLTAKNYLLRGNPAAQAVARVGKKWAYRVFGATDAVVRSGNWYGNDTVWRMSLDLNRILMYCNAKGEMTSTRKRFFSVVDGVVAMEGNGPVAGTRKEIGVLLAGTNPVAVDLACARLMGFDYRKLPILHRGLEPHRYVLMDGQYEDVRCVSDCEGWNQRLVEWLRTDSIPFKPHFGWIDHVELTD
jgi:uncharacterized protein (DUF362 family)